MCKVAFDTRNSTLVIDLCLCQVPNNDTISSDSLKEFLQRASSSSGGENHSPEFRIDSSKQGMVMERRTKCQRMVRTELSDILSLQRKNFTFIADAIALLVRYYSIQRCLLL